MEVPMKFIRFYATNDGESRFQDVEVPLPHATPDSSGGKIQQSNENPSASVQFVQLPQGLDQSWHHAPVRQMGLILSGVVEVQTSDNQKRQFRPGEGFIADDLTGKGHQTRAVGGAAALAIIRMSPTFDFGKWSG
jgi:quercetin dioxygenase-like cupin family protein